MRQSRVESMVLCALFAALTAVCAQIIIPIGAVPVSLSLLPVLLSAALLSPGEAVAAMAVYILMGLFGLPVFSGMEGGPGKLLGPTGGYIVGYVPCALAAGLGMRRFGLKWWRMALCMAGGVLVCYLFGTVWFMVSAGRDLASSMAVCVLPFLPFDALKIAVAVPVALQIRRAVVRPVGSGSGADGD